MTWLDDSSSPTSSHGEDNWIGQIRLLGWDDGLFANDEIEFTVEEYEKSGYKGAVPDCHWPYIWYIHHIHGPHHERPKIKTQDECIDEILVARGYHIRITRHGQPGEDLVAGSSWMKERLEVLHQDLIERGYPFKL